MKQYLLGAIALVTAITLNSFTLKPASHPTGTKIFEYNDYPNDFYQSNASHYTMTGNDGQDPLPCDGSAHRCGVVAQDNGSGLPDLTKPYTILVKD
jgi:hypothetical protein